MRLLILYYDEGGGDRNEALYLLHQPEVNSYVCDEINDQDYVN